MRLFGKLLIKGVIVAKTGLHIGAQKGGGGIEIGGVDNIVIRNPNGEPYIPGSSLKGKIRCLLERANGLAEDNKRIWQREGRIGLHICNAPDCFLCNIFGRNNSTEKGFKLVSGDIIQVKETSPTRLIVRDAKLDSKSLEGLDLDLPYTEVKYEASIDRITSEANPRPNERVPAGAKFEFKMLYSVYNELDRRNLKYLFEGMKLLEDDYLGGGGTRGSGQIKFEEVKMEWRPTRWYQSGEDEDKVKDDKFKINGKFPTVQGVLQNFDQLIEFISLEEAEE